MMNTSLFDYPSGNFRSLHQKIALDLIRFTSGGISRAELARQLSLTRAAISSIVDELMQKKLVRESAHAEATSGRPPVLLEIDPAGGNFIGIDFGASHVRLLVADMSVHILYEEEYELDINAGPELILNYINTKLEDVLIAAQVKLSEIAAIGVGVPGPIVREAGMVSGPPIMPGWDGFPIRDHLTRLWNRPISLNNDAELGAIGEWAYGAGRGEKHLAYIKVGTGIGSGLILDGKIYGGSSGCAGEIGHISIIEGGPICTCGNHGCLEALAGGRAIAQKARDAVRNGKRTVLNEIQPPERITAQDVAHAARLGDLVSQQIIAEAGRYLGIALADLVNLFNPSLIVIGGGVAQTGDLLLEPIRQIVAQRSLKPAARALRITSAMLGKRSSGIGALVQAVNLALHSTLKDG